MKKILLGLLIVSNILSAIEIGKVPISVKISGNNGGQVDSGAWNSSMIKGKVTVLFYIDPDKKDDNSQLTKILYNRGFDKSKYQFIAIINLGATWIPNAVIESKLAKKQKELPDNIYVKDKSKVLVKKWKLKDDSSDILVFNKKGILIYKKFGKLNRREIKKILKLVEINL